MQVTEPDEVVICAQSGPRFGWTRFGQIGTGPRFRDGRLVDWLPTVSPVMCVLPEDVGLALRPGGDDSYGGVVSTASRDGMFRVDSLDGSWIWELFPARWSDGNGGPLYVAVWRD